MGAPPGYPKDEKVGDEACQTFWRSSRGSDFVDF
jgi:hypothetical protein